MAWRYIVQRIAGPSKGTFLDWNLPLGDVEVTDSLATNWLTATIDPQIEIPLASDGRPLLDKWSTAIWAEEGGEIRGGGILVENQYAGPKRQIDVMGYSGYPHGIPLASEWSWASVEPLSVAKALWNHVQSYASGNLGLSVNLKNLSPVRLGSATEPYKLSWWEAPDCGGTLDNLMRDTPFQQKETHVWKADGTISHILDYQYPRMGTRRMDLRFVLGENVTNMPNVSDDGTYFANEVLGLGAGTGRAMIRASTAVADNRLRRVFVLNDASAVRTETLKTKVGASLLKHTGTISISTITVADHPNAPINSWQCGDEILVQADLGWTKIAQWCKILSSAIKPEVGNEAVLTLEGLTA